MKNKILWTVIGVVVLVFILTAVALIIPKLSDEAENGDNGSGYADTSYVKNPPPQPIQDDYVSKSEDIQSSREAVAPGYMINSPTSSSGGSVSTLIKLDRMLKKEGFVTIEADKPKEASIQVTLLASKFGGDILDSNSSNSDGFMTVTVTIRIPAQNYEKAIAEIQGIGEITSISSTSEDVSSEYVDLKARLTSVEKYKDILMGFLSRAKTVEESLMVSDRIRGLDSEIESYKGQIKYLEGMTAFSRIHVTITGTGGSTTINDEDSFFLTGLKKAWRAFQQAILWILQFILVLLPIAIIICLILWGILTLVKKINKPSLKA